MLQLLNNLLPVLTMPYLVRILGPSKFGLISFAQALIQYFVNLTDYGFNLTATRDISIKRDNEKDIIGMAAVNIIQITNFIKKY